MDSVAIPFEWVCLRGNEAAVINPFLHESAWRALSLVRQDGIEELRRRAVIRYMLYIHRALGDVVAQGGEADGQRVKDWIQYLLPGLMR